jgi:hypothetical protein
MGSSEQLASVFDRQRRPGTWCEWLGIEMMVWCGHAESWKASGLESY